MVFKVKLLAVALGPAGIGIFSILQNASNLILSILPIGSVGLTKYISEFYKQEKREKINYLIKKIFIHNILAVVLVCSLILFFPGSISNLLLSSYDHWDYIVLLIPVIPLGMISNFIETYLKSIRLIGKYVKLTIINTILSLIIYIPLLYYYKLYGAIVATILFYCTNIIIGSKILFKSKLIPDFKSIQIVERKIFKNIYSMGFAMLFMIAAQQVTVLIIRTIILKNYGLNSLGIYQSVFSISNNYFGLFFTTMIAYAIPKLSSLGNKKAVISEINVILKFFMVIYTPLLIICFVFRIQLINLLFTKEFGSASNLLIFQLSGEFFKAISWIMGLWFIPLAIKLKQWFLFEILFNITYLFSVYILINFYDFGIISVPFSYFISFLLFSGINLYYIKRIINFKFEQNSLKILLLSISAISVIFIISQLNVHYGFYLFAPVLLIWFKLIFDKNEYFEIKDILLDIVKNKK